MKQAWINNIAGQAKHKQTHKEIKQQSPEVILAFDDTIIGPFLTFGYIEHVHHACDWPRCRIAVVFSKRRIWRTYLRY